VRRSLRTGPTLTFVLALCTCLLNPQQAPPPPSPSLQMLVACEVAVEYYCGLLFSPQVQWLRSQEDGWGLQPEVEAEVSLCSFVRRGRALVGAGGCGGWTHVL
jgi:hypothetical protein